jgi:hypothetical protein
MDEIEQETLYQTFRSTIDDIIIDKKKNPKNTKKINKFKARINIGLHVEKDFYLWVNLIAENGSFELGKGQLEEYDLELISDPLDMMFFCSGDNSVMHMMLKKNQFGNRKLKFKGGTTGRNLGLLLKLPKILVLDKKKMK